MLQEKNNYSPSGYTASLGSVNHLGNPYGALGTPSYSSNGAYTNGSVYPPATKNDSNNDSFFSRGWGTAGLKSQDRAATIWDKGFRSSQMNVQPATYFPSTSSNATNEAASGSDIMHNDPSTALLPKSFLNSDGDLDFGHQYRSASSYTSPSSNPMSTANTLPVYHQRTSSNAAKSDFDMVDRNVSKLKTELAVKEQLIKSLTSRIDSMNEDRTLKLKQLNDKTEGSSPGTLVLPENYHQLFIDTYKVLENTKAELKETKDMLEAVVVGIALGGGSGTPTVSGHHDPQELGHKIFTKITMLQTENEQLLKMVGLGNHQGLLTEIRLLRKANDALRADN